MINKENGRTKNLPKDFTDEHLEKAGYGYSIARHIPTEDELSQYRNRTDEPLDFIVNLINDTSSREEQLMASDSFREYISLASKIHVRLEHEKQKETQMKAKTLRNNEEPQQGKLF